MIWYNDQGEKVLEVEGRRIVFPTGVFVYDPAMCDLLNRLGAVEVGDTPLDLPVQIVDPNDVSMVWIIRWSGIEARVGGRVVFSVDSDGMGVWLGAFYFVLPMRLWDRVLSYLRSIYEEN